jgi:hypothetical protein
MAGRGLARGGEHLLRFLGNELRIPLVGAGTREAYLAIRADDQLENRFAPFILPRWEAGAEACSPTREAYLAIRADDQLENRFAPFILPRWEAGAEACSPRRLLPPSSPAKRRSASAPCSWRTTPDRPSGAACSSASSHDPGLQSPAVAGAPHALAGEALTSWAGRLAAVYGMPARELLRRNLGPASALLDDPAAADLDWDPPLALLEALAERTGTGVGELRLMTVGGWVPWLADTLDAGHGPVAFLTYARQDSVLLSPGEAGANAVGRWLPWLPADTPNRRPLRRVCPECAADPDHGTPLTAAIPLMLTCPEHRLRLEAEGDVTIARSMGQPPPRRPGAGHRTALDRLTWEGLTTGTVTLPRRTVHVGVWLRMLRTLLDEVSISTSRARQRSVTALGKIWDAAGSQPRDQ